MSNLVLFVKSSNKIKFVVKDCIQNGNNFYGTNIKLQGIKLDLFDYIWTNIDVNEILNSKGEVINYDKTVAEIINTGNNTRKIIPSREEYRNAVKIKETIAQFDFDQIDKFMDLNVIDLESAKDVLKFLGKAVLAICKEIDYKIK